MNTNATKVDRVGDVPHTHTHPTTTPLASSATTSDKMELEKEKEKFAEKITTMLPQLTTVQRFQFIEAVKRFHKLFVDSLPVGQHTCRVGDAEHTIDTGDQAPT